MLLSIKREGPRELRSSVFAVGIVREKGTADDRSIGSSGNGLRADCWTFTEVVTACTAHVRG